MQKMLQVAMILLFAVLRSLHINVSLEHKYVMCLQLKQAPLISPGYTSLFQSPKNNTLKYIPLGSPSNSINFKDAAK